MEHNRKTLEGSITIRKKEGVMQDMDEKREELKRKDKMKRARRGKEPKQRLRRRSAGRGGTGNMTEHKWTRAGKWSGEAGKGANIAEQEGRRRGAGEAHMAEPRHPSALSFQRRRREVGGPFMTAPEARTRKFAHSIA